MLLLVKYYAMNINSPNNLLSPITLCSTATYIKQTRKKRKHLSQQKRTYNRMNPFRTRYSIYIIKKNIDNNWIDCTTCLYVVTDRDVCKV